MKPPAGRCFKDTTSPDLNDIVFDCAHVYLERPPAGQKSSGFTLSLVLKFPSLRCCLFSFVSGEPATVCDRGTHDHRSLLAFLCFRQSRNTYGVGRESPVTPLHSIRFSIRLGRGEAPEVSNACLLRGFD